MPAFPAKAQAWLSTSELVMSKLLFRLRHVPDDEAEEVRSLLEANEIDFFETSAGNWGISLPALWLKDESQLQQARQLLDAYQQQRQIRIRSEYEQSRQRGEARTLWHSFVEDPFRFILYVGLAGLVLFFSVQVFLSL